MTRATYTLVVTIMCLGSLARGTLAVAQEPNAPAGLAPFEPAQTMAQVGDQYILKGELVGDANLLLCEEFARIEKLPPAEQARARSALLSQRDSIVSGLLPHAVDRKLLYIQYLRTIPVQDEKKTAEKWAEVRKRSNQDFQERVTETAAKVRAAESDQYQALMRQNYQLFRVGLAMKVANVESLGDPRLELFLRRHGTSLDMQQTAYMERMLGQVGVKGEINLEPDITHDQMLAYYREHIEDYQVPTRARWEQLSVLFSRCPNKVTAGEMIRDMGNQVYFGGAPFWAVAKKHSHEKYAEQGGYHEWTAYGDLTLSRVLNEVIFSIELNKLSWIIEDDEGLHIVRVTEREAARTKSFTEAQADIKGKLKTEQINKQYNDLLAELRKTTPIWTMDDVENGPAQAAAAPNAPGPNRR